LAAYNATKQLRAENLMLRMLEIPLSKAKTADEAAKMLTESFVHRFKREQPGEKVARVQGEK
jgi:hypothetical protein